MTNPGTLTWRQLRHECSGEQTGPNGLVATFLKYNGQVVDGVRVNASSFANNFGIPRRTFSRWVRNAAPDLPRNHKTRAVPKTENPELIAELHRRLLSGQPTTGQALADEFGISRSTLTMAAAMVRVSTLDPETRTLDFNTAACRVEESIELIANVEMDLRRVLNPRYYDLGPLDRRRLRKILTEGLTNLNEKETRSGTSS